MLKRLRDTGYKSKIKYFCTLYVDKSYPHILYALYTLYANNHFDKTIENNNVHLVPHAPYIECAALVEKPRLVYQVVVGDPLPGPWLGGQTMLGVCGAHQPRSPVTAPPPSPSPGLLSSAQSGDQARLAPGHQAL